MAFDNNTIHFEIRDESLIEEATYGIKHRFQFNITTQQFSRRKKNPALAYLTRTTRINDHAVVVTTPPEDSPEEKVYVREEYQGVVCEREVYERVSYVRTHDFLTQKATLITTLQPWVALLCAREDGKQIAINIGSECCFFPVATHTPFNNATKIDTAAYNGGQHGFPTVMRYLPNDLLLHVETFPDGVPSAQGRTIIQVCDPQTLNLVTIRFSDDFFPYRDVPLTCDGRRLVRLSPDKMAVDFFDILTLQMFRMYMPANVTGPISNYVMTTNGSLLLLTKGLPNQIVELMPDFMVTAEERVQERFFQQLQAGVLDQELSQSAVQSSGSAAAAAFPDVKQTKLSELHKDCLKIIMQFAVGLADVSNSLIANVTGYPGVDEFWRDLENALPPTEKPQPLFAAGKTFKFPTIIPNPVSGGLVNVARMRIIQLEDEKIGVSYNPYTDTTVAASTSKPSGCCTIC